MTRRTLAIVSLVSAVSLSVAVRAARSGPAATLEKARTDAAAKAYALHAAQLKSGTGAVVDVEPHKREKWVVSAEGKGLDFAVAARRIRAAVREARVTPHTGMGARSWIATRLRNASMITCTSPIDRVPSRSRR